MRRKGHMSSAKLSGNSIIFLTIRRNAVFNFQIVYVNKSRRAEPGRPEIALNVGYLFCSLDHSGNHGRFQRGVIINAVCPSVYFLVLFVRGGIVTADDHRRVFKGFQEFFVADRFGRVIEPNRFTFKRGVAGLQLSRAVFKHADAERGDGKTHRFNTLVRIVAGMGHGFDQVQ